MTEVWPRLDIAKGSEYVMTKLMHEIAIVGEVRVAMSHQMLKQIRMILS